MCKTYVREKLKEMDEFDKSEKNHGKLKYLQFFYFN